MNESEQSRIIEKQDAIDILDRIIGFVNNCDSKAAIMLGIFGVIVALVFSTDGIMEIRRILDLAISNKSFCDILFILFWSVSFVILIIGFYHFLMVLMAKIDCTEMREETLELDSKVFFGNIANNITFRQYKEKLFSLDETSLLEDLASQIFINSRICTMKFEKYNKGLKLSFIGYGTFFVLWTIGTYLY